jgi:hypothetical protein
MSRNTTVVTRKSGRGAGLLPPIETANDSSNDDDDKESEPEEEESSYMRNWDRKMLVAMIDKINSDYTLCQHERSQLILELDKEREKGKQLSDQLDQLKSANEMLCSSNRSIRNGAAWSNYEKQHVSQLSPLIKQKIGGVLKFLPRGWDLWSKSKKTICGRVMGDFEIEMLENRRMVWNSIVVKHLPAELGKFKNQIGQCMKKSYKGKQFE